MVCLHKTPIHLDKLFLIASVSLAAHALRIPCVLVTNFTFDSVYSFLSTSLLDSTRPSSGENYQTYQALNALISDVPVPQELLAPLVNEIVQGYRCADVLLLLPGFIPIPSFSDFPSLPAPQWIRTSKNRFTSAIISYLRKSPHKWNLPKSVPYASTIESDGACQRKRLVVRAPLLVRPVNPEVYTSEGRSKFLSSIGVPSEFHDSVQTRVLVVSFGGQVFKKPATPSGGRTPQKRESLQDIFHKCSIRANSCGNSTSATSLPPVLVSPKETPARSSPRIATQSHIWVPGAPPAIKRERGPNSPLTPYLTPSPKFLAVPSSPVFPSITKVVPPTPPLPSYNGDRSKPIIRGLSIFSQHQNEPLVDGFVGLTEDEDFAQPTMLPAGWIAIVCGASKEQWEEVSETGECLGLPQGFFIAPRDVYMPDLTAVADVLLGKLVRMQYFFSLCRHITGVILIK
jgi:hypothetical protein